MFIGSAPGGSCAPCVGVLAATVLTCIPEAATVALLVLCIQEAIGAGQLFLNLNCILLLMIRCHSLMILYKFDTTMPRPRNKHRTSPLNLNLPINPIFR